MKKQSIRKRIRRAACVLLAGSLLLQLFPAGAMAAELSDTVTEETVPEEEYPAETVVPVGAEPTETELPETAVPMEEELPDTIGKELPEEIESTGAKN